MNTNKFLHEFQIDKEISVETETASKNEKGEEVKTIKKELIKKPFFYRLIKPNRKLFDDAELFYGVKLADGIKAGLLTRSLLAKRYQNDGGAMSEPEKQKYAQLYVNMFRKQNELEKVQMNLEKMSKDLQEAKMSEILTEMANIKDQLQEIEIYQSSLFDQTAENRARNLTIMWWALNISYISMDDKKTFVPLFGEGNFEARLKEYDRLEDSDDTTDLEAIKKIAYFISLWYLGKASTPEDFQKLENTLSQEKENTKNISVNSE
jgi:hypothetical protein